MKYQDLDEAVRIGLQLLENQKRGSAKKIFSLKTDLSAAFRMIPLARNCWKWLLMKARNPGSGSEEWSFFFDKCLPFGHSISCAIFQCFSNAPKTIVEVIANRICRSFLTNYLDDFLFIYFMPEGCDEIVIIFLDICDQIKFPVSMDKTVWACTTIVFLGMLLDGCSHTLSISTERRHQVLHMVQ